MAPAHKEATIIILDIGESANKKDDENQVSFFEKATSSIMRIIERKIFSRPDDLISLILMGTQQSNNNLHLQRGNFENISIATAFDVPSWKLLELISKKIKATKINTNWSDAVLIACDHMNEELSTKVSNKKIVLMTDLKTSPKESCTTTREIVDALKTSQIELVVIGPDLWMEEECSEPSELLNNKTKHEQENESAIRKVIFETNGIFCSFEESMALLMFYKRKQTTPYPWNVDLSIGPSIKIPVSGYGKVRTNMRIVDWKRGYKGDKSNNIEAVTDEVTYIKSNETPGDEKIVDAMNIIKSYVYGDALVPFTKIDEGMKYQCGEKCLSIYGFTESSNVHWNYLQGDGITYIVSRKDDSNANTALNALIIAMKNLDQFAIARKVYCNNRGLSLVVLFPIIEDEYNCLGMINLAFKNDFTNMMFPRIDKKVNRANEEQINAIDKLINAMDLDTGNDDNSETFVIGETPNPYLQYVFDVLSYRARHPDDELLPPPRQEIVELTEILQKLKKLSKEPLEEIRGCFELKLAKKNTDEKPWRRKKEKTNGNEENDQPTTSKIGITVKPVMKIGTVQPSEDFKAMLASGEPLSLVFSQMVSIVENMIFMAIGDDYAKPISAITVLREECMENNPNIYNKWLCDLKVVLLERYKGSFLNELIKNNLSLISNTENRDSAYNDSDIKRFADITDDQSISKINLVDTSALDDLFDD